jgi:hypothetical protein
MLVSIYLLVFSYDVKQQQFSCEWLVDLFQSVNTVKLGYNVIQGTGEITSL